MHQTLHKIALFMLLPMSSVSAFAEEESKKQSAGELTGNLTLVSKYIYRGSEENDDVAVQAGLEYAHNSGFIAGYWGSTLGYDPSDADKDSGFENDIYIAYAKQVNDDLAFRSQVTAYVYKDGGSVYEENDRRRTTGFELTNNITYKDLNVGVGVMLADASYSNAGDVYVSAAYSYTLPYEISLNSSLGLSFFNDKRDDAVIITKKHFAFTEARLGLSRSIFNTGIDASFDYIWGGKDRQGGSLDDYALFGLNYSF